MQMTKDEMTDKISTIFENVVTCYNAGYTVSSIIEHLKNDIDKRNRNNYVDDYTTFVDFDELCEFADRFKKCIAKFAEIDTQQNNSIDEDPIVSVYSAVEALVKAYDLKSPEELALIASDTQPDDSFEQFQPGIHAFMDAYDVDTAAAFNTKIYQLIASDIQDSKTNSALQQQLKALCNQVETLTGQVQQLSEQIQQLKNPPTKSE